MWWKLALNPEAVLAYYTSPPELKGVEIHSVFFHRDGPVIDLQIELPVFPDKPSKRWPAGANTAKMHLKFINVCDVTLQGWDATNVGNLIIEPDNGTIEFRFDCSHSKIIGKASAFEVQQLCGYCKDAV